MFFGVIVRIQVTLVNPLSEQFVRPFASQPVDMTRCASLANQFINYLMDEYE